MNESGELTYNQPTAASERKAAAMKIAKLEREISRLLAEQSRQLKIHKILIAAGLITQEKINEAADILAVIPEDEIL